MNIINKIYFKFLILPLIFVGVSLCLSLIFGINNTLIDLNKSVYYLLGFVVFFAIYEELLFRYIIQGGLWKMLSNGEEYYKFVKYLWILPILASSVLFTISHQIPTFSILILSFFLGIVYYYYKSIFLNIYIHVFNNVLALLLLLYI